MPGYKAHLVGGALVFAVTYYTTTSLGYQHSPLMATALLGLSLLGSLFPDLDVSSKIQRLFYFCVIGAFIGFLLAHQWNLLLTTAGLALIIGVLRHRTILHHPLFLTLLPLPFIYYLSNNNFSTTSTLFPSLFFVIGAWSHLLLDFGLPKSFKKRR